MSNQLILKTGRPLNSSQTVNEGQTSKPKPS